MQRIFHLITSRDYDKISENGCYEPLSLQVEGFIHFSYREQILRTARVHYQDETDLLVLEVDPAKVGGDVIAEDLYGLDELFPHLYGPLPIVAIMAVHGLPRNASGDFVLPAALEG